MQTWHGNADESTPNGNSNGTWLQADGTDGQIWFSPQGLSG